MYSKPGTPCNNYQGYCDVFQKCREVKFTLSSESITVYPFQVDPQGPLLTLRKLLLSDKSIATFKRFIVKYWYTVIFAAIAVIALMVGIHLVIIMINLFQLIVFLYVSSIYNNYRQLL